MKPIDGRINTIFHDSLDKHPIRETTEVISQKSVFNRIKTTPLWKKILVVGLVIIFILTSYLVIYLYARTALDDSKIRIEKIRVLGGDENSLDLEVDLILNNPTFRSVDLKKTYLDVYYKHKKVGYFNVPSLHLKSGNNHLSLQLEMVENQIGEFNYFVSDLFSSEEIVVELKGDIKTKGFFSMTLPFEKKIAIHHLDDLRIDINNLSIIDSDGDTITVEFKSIIKNPSIIETTLDGLQFDILYNNSIIATFSSTGYLTVGDNYKNFSLTITTDTIETCKSLFSDIMNGNDFSFEIKGNNTDELLLSQLSTEFSFKYIDKDLSLQGFKDLLIDVSEISVLSSNEKGIFCKVDTIITNPSIIETTLNGLKFDILYNESVLTTLSTSGYLRTGENKLSFNFLIPANTSGIYNSLISSIINGEDINFIIRGIPSNDSLLSNLSSVFNHNFIFNSSGKVSVANININSLGLFQSSLEISAVVNNPSPISVDLSIFEFSAYYKGQYVGDIIFTNPWIVQGQQNVNIFLDINYFYIITTMPELLSVIIGGGAEFLIQGKLVFDQDNILIFYLPVHVN